MKATFRLGKNLVFEVESDTQKELFEEWASISEVFGETKCGQCSDENIYPMIRRVSKDGEDFEYYEMKCAKCGAALSYGLNKKGGGMFPHRKIKNGDKEVYDTKNRGWKRWKKE